MLGIDANFRENPDKPFRLYVVCIDYGQATADRPAPLTLGYTDPMTTMPEMPILTPDGDLLLAGGYLGLSNFTPSASVLLLHLGRQTAQSPAAANRRWLLLALAGVVTLLLVFYVVRRRRCRQAHKRSGPHVRPASQQGLTPCELTPCELEPADSPTEAEAPEAVSEADRQLMERIRRLMEHERLYTNSNLKVSDVAARLNTNSRYVSECIRRSEGTTFSGYVNRYRIDYAQRLMRTDPQKKVSTFYLEAGFANESTFFRTFKAVVGTTPKEWMEREHDTDE
jgi:AraC-like DNA-binding protein